jgi:hypothetical protein
MAVREVIATQIATEDPPQVWETAQRLCAAGLGRHAVLTELGLALAYAMNKALDGHRPFDKGVYVSVLELLPQPTADELASVVVGVVREHQGIAAAEADRVALGRLGRAAEDELTRQLLDRVTEGLVDDDGPLAWLAGDRTVHVGDLTGGAVLTHRLSDSERQLGVLTVSFDLAGFARHDDLCLAGGAAVTVCSDQPGHTAWGGPDGWLDQFAAGTLLAVRVGPDSVVSIDTVREEPAWDDELVARVRHVYDREVDQPGMPVSAEQLVMALLLDDRDTFGVPRPPLAELCEAAASNVAVTRSPMTTRSGPTRPGCVGWHGSSTAWMTTPPATRPWPPSPPPTTPRSTPGVCER